MPQGSAPGNGQTGPPERDPELGRLRLELLLLGIRASVLKEQIERRLREGASLVDTSRQLREESQATMDRRRLHRER